MAKKYKITELPKAQQGAATYSDSLSIYKNALEQKAYYDKLKQWYETPQIEPWNYTGADVKQKEKEHLTYDVPNYLTPKEKAKLNKVKSQIKSNTDPNTSYLLDLITGALDPNAPVLKYDRRIKPQGEINYSTKTFQPSASYMIVAPKQDRDILYKLTNLSNDEKAIFDYIRKTKNQKIASLYDGYHSEFSSAKDDKNKLLNWAKSKGLSEKAMKTLIYKKILENKQKDVLKGFNTTLPYYDPLAVKPASQLSDAEFKKRFEKYGASGLPKSRIEKLGLKEKPKKLQGTGSKSSQQKQIDNFIPVEDTNILSLPTRPLAPITTNVPEPQYIPFTEPKKEGITLLQQVDVPRTMRVPVQTTETYYVQTYPGGPKVARQRPVTVYQEVPYTDERAGRPVQYDIQTGSYKQYGGDTSYSKYAPGGALEQNIIFSPKEGGCPDGQYYDGKECKPIPKNTKIVYSKEEYDRMMKLRRQQQTPYNEFLERERLNNLIDRSISTHFGTTPSKPKYFNRFEDIPRYGLSPLMSYGPSWAIPNGLQPGIPALGEAMVPFSQWARMLAQSPVQPIGYKGFPGGGHFYPVYSRPSNYILGYNKEDEIPKLAPLPLKTIDIDTGPKEILPQNFEYERQRPLKIVIQEQEDIWKTLPGTGTPYRVTRPVDPRLSNKRYNLRTGSYESYQDGGDTSSDYIEIDADDTEIGKLIAQGYVVEELPKAQFGQSILSGLSDVTDLLNNNNEEWPIWLSRQPQTLEEVTVKDKAPDWAKFQKEYETTKPWEDFLYDEQQKYLRRTKGLNKAAGVSMDNFPQAERIRIKQEYDQKMNDYITKRLGKAHGFNPRKRGEWVDELTDREKQIVAGSRYGSKLRPNLWSRTLSGLRSAYNATPISEVTGDITGTIPGYTKAENQEALHNWMEGANIFLPYTELFGTAPANYFTNTNPRLVRPGALSGELMPGVNPALPAVLTPWNYYDLASGVAAIPELVGSGINYAKNAYGAYRLANLSKNPRWAAEMERVFGSGYMPATEAEAVVNEARLLGNQGIPAIRTAGEPITATNVTRTFPAAEEAVTSTTIPLKPKTPVQATWTPAEPTKNIATLKSTMENSALFKVVDKKSGMININNLKAYLGKPDTPASDKAVISEIIETKFPNQKNIPWDELKQAVNEEIGQFEREYIPATTDQAKSAYASYGVDRLKISRDKFFPEYKRTSESEKLTNNINKYNLMETQANQVSQDIDYALNNYFDENGNLTAEGMNYINVNPDGTLELGPIFTPNGPTSTQYPSPTRFSSSHSSGSDLKNYLIQLKQNVENDIYSFGRKARLDQQLLDALPKASGSNDTILYHNEEKIGLGSDKHFNKDYVLGHSRVFRRDDDPNSLYFLETQSDWQQNPDKNYVFESNPQEYMHITNIYEDKIADIQKRIDNYKELLKEDDGASFLSKDQIELNLEFEELSLEGTLHEFKNWKKNAGPGTQKQLLRPKMQERLLQEEIMTAAEEGKEYVLYPTRETAAKIQGYPMTTHEDLIRDYGQNRDFYLDEINNYIGQFTGNKGQLDVPSIQNIKSSDEFLNISEVKQALEKAKASGNKYAEETIIDSAKKIAKANNNIPKHAITIEKAYSESGLLKPKSPLNKLVKTENGKEVMDTRDVVSYVYNGNLSEQDIRILKDYLYNDINLVTQEKIIFEDFKDKIAQKWVQEEKNRKIYHDDYETVLRKYDEKPSKYKKELGLDSEPYTDPEGNTWMRVKVPEKFLKKKGEIRAFKKGGNVNTFITQGDLQRFLPKAQFGYATAPRPSGFIPPKTAAQVQKEELAKGQGPTREAAQKVTQAAKVRTDYDKQAAKQRAEREAQLQNEKMERQVAASGYGPSDAAQPVDWFWTLPLGASRAGINAAYGLGESAAAAMATKIPGLAGTTVGQAINAGFIGHGLSKLPGTGKSWYDAYQSGTGDYRDAIGKTAWNSLDFLGVGEALSGLKSVSPITKFTQTAGLPSPEYTGLKALATHGEQPLLTTIPLRRSGMGHIYDNATGKYWRKIDDFDLQYQDPLKLKEYGIEKNYFPFSDIKNIEGEQFVSAETKSMINKLEARKQKALESGNQEMANHFDSLIKNLKTSGSGLGSTQSVLKEFNIPYTGKKAFSTTTLNAMGGAVELELSPEEIQWYRNNGYTVEDI